MNTTLARLQAMLLAGGLIVAAPAPAQDHPLDPLTPREHWTVLEVLEREGRLDESTAFHSVNLLEPPKTEVWSFSAGDTIERRALAVVTSGSEAA